MRTGKLKAWAEWSRAVESCGLLVGALTLYRLAAIARESHDSRQRYSPRSKCRRTEASARNAIDVKGIGPSTFCGFSVEPGSCLQASFHRFKAVLQDGLVSLEWKARQDALTRGSQGHFPEERLFLGFWTVVPGISFEEVLAIG